jgi:hypothetical protein
MGWTKRQFIDRALSGIGLGKRSYTASAEDYSDALEIADSMVAEWQGRLGLGIGWPLTSNPDDSSLDDATEVPLPYVACVWSNLAVLIGPEFGKQAFRETKVLASESYNTMSKNLSKPRPKQQPQGVPLGGGNRWRRRIFTPKPDEFSESTDNTIERP